MNTTPDIKPYQNELPGPGIIEWLLRAKATAVLRSIHFWIISALVAILIYVYYADVITFPDAYVVLFLFPLVYAAIVYRLRGAVGTWLVLLLALLPWSMLISGDPSSLARALACSAFCHDCNGGSGRLPVSDVGRKVPWSR